MAQATKLIQTNGNGQMKKRRGVGVRRTGPSETVVSYFRSIEIQVDSCFMGGCHGVDALTQGGFDAKSRRLVGLPGAWNGSLRS